jgi:hypothetical protein
MPVPYGLIGKRQFSKMPGELKNVVYLVLLCDQKIMRGRSVRVEAYAVRLYRIAVLVINGKFAASPGKRVKPADRREYPAAYFVIENDLIEGTSLSLRSMKNAVTGRPHVASYRVPAEKIPVAAPFILKTTLKVNPDKRFYQFSVLMDQVERRSVKIGAVPTAGVRAVRPYAPALAKTLLREALPGYI